MNTLIKSTESQASSNAGSASADIYQEFADLLIDKNDLREGDLKKARRLAEQAGDEKLPSLLVKLGLVAEKDVANALVEITGIPFTTQGDYPKPRLWVTIYRLNF